MGFHGGVSHPTSPAALTRMTRPRRRELSVDVKRVEWCQPADASRVWSRTVTSTIGCSMSADASTLIVRISRLPLSGPVRAVTRGSEQWGEPPECDFDGVAVFSGAPPRSSPHLLRGASIRARDTMLRRP